MANDPKIRILIIEDDAGFRDLLRLHVSMAGYGAELAVDGVEGGKAVLASPPDLVLCDLNMPLLSGLELLALMRSHEQTASIPVVLLSGRSESETVNKAMELGAADFLTKPVTRENLMKSIHACLAKGGRTAAA
jgi:DNA-binding response OmpR family regulator